ncbi:MULTISPECIES: hypothetical protein [unclassified Pseudomonas]|uniref:hypothetical protein n=1 Tax=unclassified Pseudomonas TaxID=196821 RepID=UPI002AC8ACED|nr:MULTISPECIES: hypothetical protein [unclassified Pseudomonas]MEB0045402.1 hypothetical protein [Pseudomonas sp. Dout3]MEB0097020.1 hypothetical protein [Pseudomonas sp. DC1.2]WPX60546.1 hypothetical protein RHM68_07900 [Pseudomonas sp. DC1.2]
MTAYLEMCPPVIESEHGWSSRVNEGRLGLYIERYGSVVVLVELLNQFAVRCVRGAYDTTRSTHYVPALISGLQSLNPLRISRLTGRVSLDSGAGRVEVFGSLGSDNRNCLLATITVLNLKGQQS